MKRKYLLLFLFFVVVALIGIACLTQRITVSQPGSNAIVNKQKIEIFSLEIPAPHFEFQVVEHPGFTLAYNEAHEQAAWVAYELTAAEVAGSVSRTDRFMIDPAITTESANAEDYKGSGYDRGHLAPAADMKWSEEAMIASFYFSNMSPQLPSFNRGVWKKAEEQVREWARNYEAVYIVTGPVFAVDVEQIGKNAVSVPVYYYKALIDKRIEKAVALLIPHKPSKRSLADFCVSIDSLEILTGLDFFYLLPDEMEAEMESAVDPDDWLWLH
ncbi:MAG: DNA/RNA non-specific endonuclease [Paludibacteraceae bacterium]|nr:DNA/RNA non-specific endonuclease [Paludibacteraceae bacterium]